MNTAPALRVCSSAADLDQVFRFRYAVYVEEMQRVQYDADHARKRIVDALDSFGVNVGAWVGDELVGVVRINLPRLGSVGKYEEYYQMRSVGDDHPRRTAMITRFMVAPSYRRSLLAVSFCRWCYRFGLEQGVRWNFIDCNEHLVEFFTKIGYRQHVPCFEHPEYGRVTPLCFDCHDFAHLEWIGSPLAAVHREWTRQKPAVPASPATF
ncbi:MAG TPA: GNAT family N-acetyltransferase [Candidatus Didemnitutus sp.]|nr:GNAT family N-acetyltransferase [Candidatus Didemnitutus sp.]